MRVVLCVMLLAIGSSAAAQTPQGGAPAAAPATAAAPASVTSATAPPTVSPATAVANKGKAADDPNKLVCKSEPVLGSRMAVKHCVTAGEAAMNKIDQRQSLERMQGSTYQR